MSRRRHAKTLQRPVSPEAAHAAIEEDLYGIGKAVPKAEPAAPANEHTAALPAGPPAHEPVDYVREAYAKRAPSAEEVLSELAGVPTRSLTAKTQAAKILERITEAVRGAP